MESAYRTWLRARKKWEAAQNLDERSRELQMALGTAKWQVDSLFRVTEFCTSFYHFCSAIAGLEAGLLLAGASSLPPYLSVCVLTGGPKNLRLSFLPIARFEIL
ncbi:unnamed protein product [Fraxinus pennsylvanica]|uniref:Uncharacterized protein n=1 Tax=Fraxinus pennsylvanica TaxID=56036 RepID=A0AAD2DK73_9LAMI|nr:unnamed protein product [Fraxinus pennsylvanica]